MSVCVVCNISDGVVIGVDSATTIGNPTNPAKVYEDVPKLFPLGDLPVGLATFGLASIAGRTIASWTHEFSQGLMSGGPVLMEDISESARAFFWEQYRTHVREPMASELGVDPEAIPEDTLPVLGIVIGGFSANSYYSEVWTISIPAAKSVGSAVCLMPKQHFGSAWFAMGDPIKRYVKGVDSAVLFELMNFVDQIREPLTQAERLHFMELGHSREYPIVFDGMPIAKGLKYVRYLVDLVIGHHMFTMGASVVGGRCRVGYVDYEKKRFQVVE